MLTKTLQPGVNRSLRTKDGTIDECCNQRDCQCTEVAESRIAKEFSVFDGIGLGSFVFRWRLVFRLRL